MSADRIKGKEKELVSDGVVLSDHVERVCVIIPMYKVEEYIQDVIREIPVWVWRIIIVDDASPDKSAQLALDTDDERVLLVRNEENLGVGGAMLRGFSKAVKIGATILVKVDGDNQMPLDYLPALLDPILSGKADYVKGNRFVHSKMIHQMPFKRRIGNIGLSFLTKVASGYWNIFDPTNGYTALDGDVFIRIDQSNISQRYFFETSMLIELNLLRAVVADVPMPARYPHAFSTLSIGKIIRDFPPLLLHGFIRRILLQYIILDFSVPSLFAILGILLCTFGSIWGGTSWVRSIQTGVPATTGTVMISVLPIILGFQLLLQATVADMQNAPEVVISKYAQIRKKIWDNYLGFHLDKKGGSSLANRDSHPVDKYT
jgi:glycosyltransferase involved in cell wall biosynthesis